MTSTKRVELYEQAPETDAMPHASGRSMELFHGQDRDPLQLIRLNLVRQPAYVLMWDHCLGRMDAPKKEAAWP